MYLKKSFKHVSRIGIVGKVNTFDKRLFLITVILTLVGLVALADASAPLAIRSFSDKFFFVKQQAVWAAVGFFLMMVASRLNYKTWEKVATPIFLLSLLSLVLVLVPGLGVKVLGAKRWITLGNFTLQPSEFVKLALVIYMAKVTTQTKKLLAYFFPIIATGFLIMLQPDLGTMMVIAVSSMLEIFVSGISLLRFFGASLAGGMISLALILISDYRRERLLTFLEISNDPQNAGYHIRQILLALGSGGLLGVGLGHSRQKYLFLPETATDSIFAVIAEEVGFMGASILIVALGFYVVQGIKIARHAPDAFSFVLATGITAWVGTQTIFNIGSMIAVVPLTGIPLPFISYGGSSLVMLLVGTGILLNISKYE